ncbi:MAG: 3-phosphoshikimate 1-carboxyvinyltransferase [Eubacterium sp.]|jgi:3-phosphoshikimate 1-carboxyvinyltransferase
MKQTYFDVTAVSRPIACEVEVPGSKSITNRALLLSALSTGKTVLKGALFSEDARCFLDSLKRLGYQIRVSEADREVTVEGAGSSIPAKSGEIYVGSAGTAARFLTAMLGLSDGIYTIQASEQMKKRPMKDLFAALEQLGAAFDYLETPYHLPVRVTGRRAEARAFAAPDAQKAAAAAESPIGELVSEDYQPEIHDQAENCAVCPNRETCQAGRTRGSAGQKAAPAQIWSGPLETQLDISTSTQYLSALLLTSPLIPEGLMIRITSEKKAGSYVAVTRQMMEQFGMRSMYIDGCYYTPEGQNCGGPAEYRIEPDVSAACYFYAGAAITGSSILVKHIHPDMMQGDVRFLNVLQQMGCRYEDTGAGVRLTGAGPQLPCLKGIRLNMNDFSDQALTLAAIAPYADSPVEISGIGHIRRQESDRIHAMRSNLEAAGIRCQERPDGILIEPGQPQPCEIETYEDHRVAMAFSLLGLRAEGIRILNPECCGKTFPEYFEVFARVFGEKDS